MAIVRLFGAQNLFGVWPAACAVGIAGAVALGRWTSVSGLLIKLGRQTLPIYVMHMPLLALLTAALVGPFSRAGTPLQLLLAALLPIILVGPARHGAPHAQHLAATCRTTWLFDLPTPRRSTSGRPPARNWSSPRGELAEADHRRRVPGEQVVVEVDR